MTPIDSLQFAKYYLWMFVEGDHLFFTATMDGSEERPHDPPKEDSACGG